MPYDTTPRYYIPRHRKRVQAFQFHPALRLSYVTSDLVPIGLKHFRAEYWLQTGLGTLEGPLMNGDYILIYESGVRTTMRAHDFHTLFEEEDIEVPTMTKDLIGAEDGSAEETAEET